MLYLWLLWCILSASIISWCCAKVSIGWISFFTAIVLSILSCILFYHIYFKHQLSY